MRTRHALAALLFLASPGLATAQALSSGVTAMVQEKLQQVGVHAGRADGVWGPESRAALEHFQQTRNLQVTGELNEAPDAAAAAPAAAPAVPELVNPAVIRNVQQRLQALGLDPNKRATRPR